MLYKSCWRNAPNVNVCSLMLVRLDVYFSLLLFIECEKGSYVSSSTFQHPFKRHFAYTTHLTKSKRFLTILKKIYNIDIMSTMCPFHRNLTIILFSYICLNNKLSIFTYMPFFWHHGLHV